MQCAILLVLNHLSEARRQLKSFIINRAPAAEGGLHPPYVTAPHETRLNRRCGRRVHKDGAQNRLRLVEKLPCFVEIGAGLLLHRSMPSARIAYIKGMRGSL